MRLKTYVMLLAATGMESPEALSIRICDLDLESNPSRAICRGEYTKTRSDRTYSADPRSSTTTYVLVRV